MSNQIIYASDDSPPPFHWDSWYSQIGGRKIKIEEVDAILKQIYEEQYKRFEGAVNTEKTIFPVSYTHLRAHETVLDLVCRLLLEKKKKKITTTIINMHI